MPRFGCIKIEILKFKTKWQYIMAKKFVLGELTETHSVVTEIKTKLEAAAKQQVAVIIIGKMVKKAGEATKMITYNFENGQSISLVMRTDGDVIKHLLNNKNIPLIRVMDLDNRREFDAGLEDLALKLKGNQEKFDIKRMSARVVIPRDKAPALTVKKRISQARETLAELSVMLNERKAALEAKKTELKSLKGAAA